MTQKRMQHIDGLRGAACAAVVLYHFGLLPGGKHGVDVFFVLSGWLITGILLRERGKQTFSLMDFYYRRIRRLLPALSVFLLAVAVAASLAPRLFPLAPGRPLLASLLYYANWASIRQTWELTATSHIWSLAIEGQFYLSWGLLCALLFRLRASVRTIGLLTLLLIAASTLVRLWLYKHGASEVRIYRGTDTRLDGLFLGCLVACLPCPAISKQVAHYAAIMALWGLCLLCLFETRNNLTGWSSISAACLATALIVWLSPQTEHMNALLSEPTLVYLGTRSYSLYLWHYPISKFPFGVIAQMPHQLHVLLGIGIALILAELSYRYIERPLILRSKASPYTV